MFSTIRINKFYLFNIFLTVVNIYLFCQLTSISRNFELSQQDCERAIHQQCKEICQPEKCNMKPSLEYERLRRRIRTTVQYMCEYVKHKLWTLNASKDKQKHLKDLLETLREHKISFLSDWQAMTDNDGFNEFRKMEADQLSKIIQKRFDFLMNPKDCSSVKYFKCRGEFACGWGCQLNGYVACFSVAFGLRMKLVFSKWEGQFYEPDEYELFYEPVSTNCNEIPIGITEVEWPGNSSSVILKSPKMLRREEPRIKYNLLSLPEDLAARMELVFEEPRAWWSGQIMKFLFKLKPETAKVINDTAVKIGFKFPIVSVHIRRGNKKEEANYQPVEYYMDKVDEIYEQLELTRKIEKRRIFLCSDDPTVIRDIWKKYPSYQVIVNEEDFKNISDYQHVNKSSMSVLTDVMLTAMSNFSVGTLSSNLGRRALEFKYINDINAMEHYFSLDNRYFEYGEIRRRFKVIINHEPRDETEMKAQVGDMLEPNFGLLRVLDQYGFMPMVKEKNVTWGQIPSFKLQEIFDTVDFPTFDIFE